MEEHGKYEIVIEWFIPRHSRFVEKLSRPRAQRQLRHHIKEQGLDWKNYTVVIADDTDAAFTFKYSLRVIFSIQGGYATIHVDQAR